MSLIFYDFFYDDEKKTHIEFFDDQKWEEKWVYKMKQEYFLETKETHTQKRIKQSIVYNFKKLLHKMKKQI